MCVEGLSTLSSLKSQCEHFLCVGDGWSEDGLTLLEDLTYSASWKPVMVKVMDATVHSVSIVDTNTEEV